MTSETERTEAPVQRDTPLARELKRRILRDGPLRVEDYLDACLNDPVYGYYRTRTAIGADGDFVTAPEISQVFGELIGLWCALVWMAFGAPARCQLIELGPGRGTLMRDALRAASTVRGFRDAISVELVEQNPVLARLQATTLAGCGVPVSHRERITDAFVPGMAGPQDRHESGCAIVIANEFLDVFPVRQVVMTDGRWRQRTVELDREGAFRFGIGSPCKAALPPDLEPAQEGDIFEYALDHASLIEHLAGGASAYPHAALFIDYGHTAHGIGDTLQAVRGHRAETIFASPGEADITAHVDFAGFARAAGNRGFGVDGPVPQGEFLGRLGIIERASRLMAANPSRAVDIETAVARLMAPNGMGTRFKAIALRPATMAPLPGF